MKVPQNKWPYIILELAHHLPFSIFGVISAMILMAILTFLAKIAGSAQLMPSAAKDMFHIFHPSHVLFSAVATTAMFWKHDDHNLGKAIAIGFIGSVGICGISDIFFPYLGGMTLGYRMDMHICIIEEPELIFPFAIVGILAGFMVTKSLDRSTEYSHSVHVFISSAASLLYLISFGLIDWMHAVTGVFFVTVIAVWFPCCLSDIIFPMICTHKHCHHKKTEVYHS